MGWISPTGFVDSSGWWYTETNAYDEDTLTHSYSADTGFYLELTHAAISCTKVRVFVDEHLQDDPWTPNDPDIDIDVYYSSGWNNIFSGSITNRAWVEKAVGSTQSITAMRIKFNVNQTPRHYSIYEVDFWERTDYTRNVALTMSLALSADRGVASSRRAPLAPFVLPTGHSDPNSTWNDETSAYDGSTVTYAVSLNISTPSWGNYLELTHAAINCDRIGFYADDYEDTGQNVDIDAYYDSDWHDVYEGTFTDETWYEKALDGKHSVTKARVRFYHSTSGYKGLYMLQFTSIASNTLAMGLALSATRGVVTYVRSATKALGLALSATRGVVTYNRSASKVLGLALSATKVAGYTRTASKALGLVVSATKVAGYVRSANKALGLVVSASRTIGYARSATRALGLVVSATRIYGRVRTSTMQLGLVVSASRTVAYNRTASKALGLVVSAARVYGRVRSAVLQLGMAVSASRSWGRTRTASLQLGLVVSATVIPSLKRILQITTEAGRIYFVSTVSDRIYKVKSVTDWIYKITHKEG